MNCPCVDLGWPSLLILTAMHFLEYTVQYHTKKICGLNNTAIYAMPSNAHVYDSGFHVSEMEKGFTVYFISGIALKQ